MGRSLRSSRLLEEEAAAVLGLLVGSLELSPGWHEYVLGELLAW